MDKDSKSHVRVVVVSYNSGPELLDLAESLRSHLCVPHHIVIYNNGGSLEHLKKYIRENHIENFYLVDSPKNMGFAAGVNRAVEYQAPNQLQWTDLLVINPDAKLLDPITPQTLNKIHSFNGIVGPAVYDDDLKKRRQMSARSFPNLLTSITNREGLLTKLWPQNPYSKKYLGKDLTGTQPVDWISGCCLICPRNIWNQTGGFYEGYFFGVEDVDLGKTASKKGIPIVYFPEISIKHVGSLSSQKSLRSEFYHHLGMWTYHVRWSGMWGFFMGPFIFLGIFSRFLLRALQKRAFGHP